MVQTQLQTSRLLTVAGRFHPPGFIAAVAPLGQGNVNDTHLVSLRGEAAAPPAARAAPRA